MSCRPKRRQDLIDPTDEVLSLTRQCQLLKISRGSVYYKSPPPSRDTTELLQRIDEIYTQRPYYGKRRICWSLQQEGFSIGIKRTRSLMQKLGLEAIGPRPNTSQSHPQNPVYPYLLKGRKIKQANQVWATDITYIRLQQGWIYLLSIMDWHSRYVLSWELSITLETTFCNEALDQALKSYPPPEIFNSDQGCQFTSWSFTNRLQQAGIQISMDGRGRYLDNIFIERLWRSLKYEEVYTKQYETVSEARQSIAEYFEFYNHHRPHQALDYLTPAHIYFNSHSPA